MTKKAPPQTQQGVMIALYPPMTVAEQIAIPNYEAPEAIHCTLAYLGNVDDIEDPEALRRCVGEFAAQNFRLTGRIDGLGRFSQVQSDNTQAFYASVNVPELPHFRHELCECLDEEADIEVSNTHGFTPHMTLAYINPIDPMPIQSMGIVPVTFDRLSLVIGTQRYDYALITETAAFEQVKAGARNSSVDMKRIQGAHDLMCELGAKCMERDDIIYRSKAIDFTPPADVRKAYQNGLKRHEDGETGDGMEAATLAQARKFAGGGACSPEWARKGNRWWGRNQRFAEAEPGTPAYAAAQLWGGRNWFAPIVRALDNTEKTTDVDAALEVTSPTHPNDNSSSSAIVAPATDNALKAVSETDDTLIVTNRIVLFGGRDLEGVVNTNKNADGSTGEFFTKSTKLESDYTAIGRLPVDWEHGRGADGLGKDDVLGYVDWTTAKADNSGIWVQRILNRRNAYVKMLETLIKAGMIGTSSEAIPDQVMKKADGEIVRWPLRRDTLTVSPMEPRMLSENQITALKALAEELPMFKSACDRLGIDTGANETDRLRLKQKLIQYEVEGI